MSNALTQKEELLSSKDAGKILGYTHDYISKLCREGKMSGIQKGRVWFVTEQEVHSFKERHEAELIEKKNQLSQKFSEMRSQYESKKLEGPRFDIPVYQNIKIPFTVPKQIIAASVLAFVLMTPSLVNNLQKSTTSTSSLSSVSTSINFDTKSMIEHIDVGIASVIGAQSDFYIQTANTFSFLGYLSDGYWQLATNAIILSKGFYSFLEIISDGYLALYLVQGEIIYNSFLEIESMGAMVLSGYELLGRSFVVGSYNIIDTYKNLLNIDSNLESSKKKLSKFTSDTSEGLVYTQSHVKTNVISVLLHELKQSFFVVLSNIRSNIFYVSQTTKDVSSVLSASAVHMFTLNFATPKDDFLKVELQK